MGVWPPERAGPLTCEPARARCARTVAARTPAASPRMSGPSTHRSHATPGAGRPKAVSVTGPGGVAVKVCPSLVATDAPLRPSAECSLRSLLLGPRTRGRAATAAELFCSLSSLPSHVRAPKELTQQRYGATFCAAPDPLSSQNTRSQGVPKRSSGRGDGGRGGRGEGGRGEAGAGRSTGQAPRTRGPRPPRVRARITWHTRHGRSATAMWPASPGHQAPVRGSQIERSSAHLMASLPRRPARFSKCCTAFRASIECRLEYLRVAGGARRRAVGVASCCVESAVDGNHGGPAGE